MRVEQLSSQETERFLKSRSSGVLAVSMGEIPYCVPMAYGYDGESLYFMVSNTGRLLDYMRAGANTGCFTVFEAGLESDSYISVILEGPVSKVAGHEIMHAASAIERQLRKPKGSLRGLAESSQGSERAGIYKLSIRSRSGRKKTGGVF